MKLPINKKADVNNRRVDNITALMAASAGGYADIVKQLLRAGADANMRDKDGLTALVNAAENGSVPTVQALLDRAMAAVDGRRLAFPRRGWSEASVGFVEQALGVDPQHARAYDNLGIALEEKGEMEAAKTLSTMSEGAGT